MISNQITGRLITRNWVFNIIGQGFPLVVGLFTIPWLLHYLGLERFGILSISWALLGYVGQFDLGLGRATTKYAAECLGRGEMHRLPAFFWTSLLSQIISGIIAAVLLAAATPFLVNRVLKISPAQIGETKIILFILAAAFPLIIATNSLRGLLEAGQQFAIINYVKVPANISIFLLPVLGIPFGIQLPGIMFLLVGARFAAAVAYLVFCFKFFPVLRERFVVDTELLRPLFVYGGWITVSNLVGPLLTYVDRFFVGAILSMSAVGYYSAPYEIATKIWFIPASLLATVFPAFTSLYASESQKQLENLYVRSLKSILLVSGSLLLIVAAFARPILSAWLGPSFAINSSSVLQILAFGVLVNCIGFVPFGLLQGLGRPDLTAKFHLAELPFYALALWFLTSRLGLLGAAWAWTLRAVLDTVLLFGAVLRLKLVSSNSLAEHTLQRALIVLALPAVLLPLSWIKTPLIFQTALSGLILVAFMTAAWGYALDHSERNLLLTAVVHFRSRFTRAK